MQNDSQDKAWALTRMCRCCGGPDRRHLRVDYCREANSLDLGHPLLGGRFRTHKRHHCGTGCGCWTCLHGRCRCPYRAGPESLRLMVTGARCPGGLLPPMTAPCSRYRLWRRFDVARWLTKHLGQELPTIDDEVLSAINAAWHCVNTNVASRDQKTPRGCSLGQLVREWRSRTCGQETTGNSRYLPQARPCSRRM